MRGTPERTFALGEGAVITQDQLEHATGADHFRYFATWVAGLLDEFGRYTRRERIDVIADGVGYRDHVLHLTDEELRELLAEIRAAIAARAEHAPRPDRTARLLSTVTMSVDRPESEGPPRVTDVATPRQANRIRLSALLLIPAPIVALAIIIAVAGAPRSRAKPEDP